MHKDSEVTLFRTLLDRLKAFGILDFVQKSGYNHLNVPQSLFLLRIKDRDREGPIVTRGDFLVLDPRPSPLFAEPPS